MASWPNRLSKCVLEAGEKEKKKNRRSTHSFRSWIFLINTEWHLFNYYEFFKQYVQRISQRAKEVHYLESCPLNAMRGVDGGRRWTELSEEQHLWPIEEGTKNKPVAKSISRLQTSEPRLAGCSASVRCLSSRWSVCTTCLDGICINWVDR